MNNRLKELRNALKMSQESFAETIGVSRITVSQWENGEKPISKSGLKLLYGSINVNQTWLETGEGPMFTVEKSPLDALNNVNLLVELAKRSIDCLDDQTRATIVSFVTELSKKLSND